MRLGELSRDAVRESGGVAEQGSELGAPEDEEPHVGEGLERAARVVTSEHRAGAVDIANRKRPHRPAIVADGRSGKDDVHPVRPAVLGVNDRAGGHGDLGASAPDSMDVAGRARREQPSTRHVREVTGEQGHGQNRRATLKFGKP